MLNALGYTDLPSRLPTQASTLYANNISKFLLSIGEKEHYNINLEDEVVRGSIILHEVNLLCVSALQTVLLFIMSPVDSLLENM